ncbi:MAG: undecaprenyl-diphosphate phosphatase [Candidatus Kaelpia aquatica]|nr:undecaprenyl-diphosphate phosphatase [Candidatus Kaelpia aquatica]
MKFDLLILSFIQGIAEFLPISSSGHLLFLSNLLNLNIDKFIFTIFLHLAALLAILFYFYPRIKILLKDNIYILKVLAAFCTTIIVALYLRRYVVAIYNMEGLNILGPFFIISGVLLFLPRLRKNQSQSLTFKSALLIGFVQGVSVFPGISRSGITIVLALLLGLTREEAFRFSFLLAIPTIIGAGVYELLKSSWNFQAFNVINISYVGYFVITFIVSLASLAILEKTVFRKKLSFFGYYCCIIGLIVLFIGG